jgi:orotidine-5'-phosphate decarboxylase
LTFACAHETDICTFNAEGRVNAIPIVALDFASLKEAQSMVRELDVRCDFYKVGLELYAAEGPRVVQVLREQGKRVFVDLKLHDIPNTVKSATRAVARLGASLLTVHASGGEGMIRAAVEGAHEGGGACGVLAVTVLTSFTADSLAASWGREALNVTAEVLRLAAIAQRSGAHGVVCSGHELGLLKQQFGAGLRALVPGIRMAGGDAHDQQRVMTPDVAAHWGADYLVLGRAVTAAASPAATMGEVLRLLRDGNAEHG